MFASFFERQVAMYASYHRDPRNRLTHYVGVPTITLSVFMALALWRWGGAGFSISAGTGLFALMGLLWLVLHPVIGAVLVALMLPLYGIGEYLTAVLPTTTVWILAGIMFVGGWVLQFVGHAFEGRRPAFLDNGFQVFVAPMFFAAELMAVLGMTRWVPPGVLAEMHPETGA